MDERRLRAVALVARAISIGVAGAIAVAMAAPGVGAHDDGTTGHLWLDHLKVMKTPGTINQSTNPVDWTKLKGVPPGIADGNDAGVESAGFGLKKAYSIFFVDASVIQRRLATTCAAGQTIRSIASNGSATCTTGPHGVSLRIADTGPMCDGDCTEGTVVLTPGKWAIFAKIVVRQSIADEDRIQAHCHLDAGGKSDDATYAVRDLGGAGTIPMQLIATLSGNLHATVNCGDTDYGQTIGSDLTIDAIRLAD